MKRRNFLTQLSLGAAASVALPATQLFSKDNNLILPEYSNENQDKKKLGIALVGLGYYSTSELAPALQKTKNCYLAGIVTGSPEKAQKWKEQYNIPEKNIYNYQNFDAIKDNPDIDIVYVVLPNAMHAEYTIRAAKAGKHVLCEKPMEVNVEKCQEMIKACKENNRLLAIGYRLHYDPYHQEIMKYAGEKPFGKIKTFTSGNAFNLNYKNWRTDPALSGGGPLMDMGIYCVQSSLYATGEHPIAVTAKFGEKTEKERFPTVEQSISWKFDFPSGAVADCKTSYADVYGSLRTEAENGWYELSPAYTYRGVKGKTSKGELNFPQVPQQAAQMDDFADCVLNKKQTRVPGEMGMRDVKLLLAIYESAKSGKKITIA